MEEPIPGHDAFFQSSRDAELSQAAVLASLGRLMGAAWVAPRGGDAREEQARFIAGFPEGDFERLGVPRIDPLARKVSAKDDLAIRGRMLQRMPKGLGERAQTRTDEVRASADLFFTQPEPTTALDLLGTSLAHPSPHARAAAAWAYGACLQNPEPAVPILAELLRASTRRGNTDTLLQDMTSTALARFVPGHPELERLARTKARARRGRPSNTSLLIHGTFAKNNDWWQPGGDFHTYLLNNVSSDLYSASDRFDWSGTWSDPARQAAAPELIQWLSRHGHVRPRLYTHSHGGSVAMIATTQGLQLEKLVLLSCPAHPADYLPNFGNVQDVISIRVHADLVIFIDGGDQKFNVPGITEHVLSVWFNHSATHEPGVWQAENVPGML
jgi:hypothetical protein